MKYIYLIEILIFSSEIYGDSYIDQTQAFLSEEAAVTFILENGLLDKGYEDVYVISIPIKE
jgi:hypothetical protein